MRWLQNISFSSPSSSSSSPVSSHHSSSAYSSRNRSDITKNHLNYNNNNNNSNNNNRTAVNNNSNNQHTSNNNDFNNNNNNQQQLQPQSNRDTRKRGPRLTRQKKLRHLSDQEMIGVGNLPQVESAESVVLSRSSSHYDQFSSSSTLKSPTSSTVIAQPLPLPLPLPVPEENGELRLPSPRDGGGNGRGWEERERDLFRDRDRVDGAGDGVSSPLASVGRKMPVNMDIRPSRTVHQDLFSVENSRENFRLNIPVKSAPTSPFASPALSPKRTSVGEMFQNYYKPPKGSQGWSAPEIQHLEIPGLPPPAFFDYTAFSTESSPFHSPRSRSPCRNPISPTGPSSPIHSKLSRESTGLLEVHPLPLPPGAAISLPSSPIRQLPAKPEFLPMTDQWQKGKLIGRGTFGSVYVASNRETGALCAMKEVELFPDDPKSAECIKQLEQEIKVLSHLKHPNIVQYYGSEIVEDKFYIYLEYVHPGSINKYVREHCGAITESVVRNFTRHILSGLAYLHSKKTIHRDIKGANLLVDALGVVKLADFGMAKHLTGQAADLSLKGSPYWMAPELMMAVMQRDNNSDLALAVDIWSLGCTIIEMFTGKPPWSEYEGAAAMFKVMKDTPPVPENLSVEGKDFLRCCFQRNPAERPTASMLLEHRFVKNSQQPDVPSCSQSFTGMKLTDKPQSPRERYENRFDQSPIPSNLLSPKKMTSESENGQRSNPETSDLTVSCNYSPRSILEDLPSLSPFHTGCRMHHSGPSSVILDRVRRGSKKNFICH